MGIRPNKSGDIIVNPPDNSQSRWGEWVAGLEGAGDTAGGVVSEIDAKAESANSGSGELAGDLTALEGRVEAVETGKANTAHAHTSAQITDSTFHVGRADRIGFLLRTGDTGQLAVQTDSITGPAHVTNKRYVDDGISSAVAALAARIEAIEQRLTDAGL